MREKVESVKRAKTQGGESGSRSPVPGLVEHQLVPINELTESVEDSKSGEESGDEVWEITYEEFVGLSPKL